MSNDQTQTQTSTKDQERLKFVGDFSPQNYVVVFTVDPRNKIIAFDGEFKGRKYFNLRIVFKYDEEDAEWNPGKGLSIRAEKKAAFIEALKANLR